MQSAVSSSRASAASVIVRDCDGSGSDASALVEFDRRMSAELLGNDNEERLSETFLQQVQQHLHNPDRPHHKPLHFVRAPHHHAAQVADPLAASFVHWRACVAELPGVGIVGACIWKLVKNGVRRHVVALPSVCFCNICPGTAARARQRCPNEADVAWTTRSCFSCTCYRRYAFAIGCGALLTVFRQQRRKGAGKALLR
jgi:hypothetical protein